MTAKTLIRAAQLPDGSSADILLSDGKIIQVGKISRALGATTIDAAGLVVLPGLVDLHTHLREPGGEPAETVFTGTRAAAAGGYTAVFAMANTTPVADTVAVVEQVAALGRAGGYARVQPIGAVTIGLQGERLAELGAMAKSKARVSVFSDDGHCVHDPLLMRRALEYTKAFGGVIAQHAQEPRLTQGAQMNEGVLSGRLGLTGWPAVAEEAIIARDVLLAEHVGARLHVCHVSTAGSVEIIRWAKARGIAVTAEVTPHHLLLTEENVSGYDARYKVNPPLRRAEDVSALRAALADGTIDIVATDHAPHPVEAKECEWDVAANGMVGLEAALAVVHTTMVATGKIGWPDVARVMSQTPARIGQLSGHGGKIAAGEPAELCLIDPASKTIFGNEHLVGRSSNSPYLGMELSASVKWTFHDGYATVVDGAIRAAEDIAELATTSSAAKLRVTYGETDG